jgi:hypothetical protein
MTYDAVLLPGLLLQHDDPVRALVQGGGQTVPLSVQRLPSSHLSSSSLKYIDLVIHGFFASKRSGTASEMSRKCSTKLCFK